MSYKTFALKWRPQTFDEIVGQQHIATTLKNAIRLKRVANAYLFAGPRGTGKTSTARILAKALNCKEGPTPTPCNVCQNCKEIAVSNNLDVLEIDGASNRGIDAMRNLRENVKLSASNSPYRIYIIDEVHMLTEPAFNALLKTLEEPPLHVKFIFATTQPQKILSTILSRCQRFDFRRIPTQDIVKKLQEVVKEEKIKIDDEAIFAIARASDGSLRDAESILDQLASHSGKKIQLDDVNALLGSVGQSFLFALTEMIIGKDTAGALSLLNEIIGKGKDILILVSEMIEHCRNMLIVKEVERFQELLDISDEALERTKEQAGHFSKEDILYIFSVLSKVQYEMERHPIQRIPLEMVFVRLTTKEKMLDADTLMRKLESFEDKLKGCSQDIAHTPPAPEDRSVNEGQESVIMPYAQKENLNQDQTIQPSNLNYEEFRPIWEKACTRIKEIKTPVGLYISEGTPIHLEKHQLTVGFYPGFAFHKENLEEKANKKLVEKVLSEFLNQKIKVKFMHITSKPKESIPEPTPPPETNDKPEEAPQPQETKDSVVSSAMKLFGGLIVKDEGKKA